MRILSAAFLLSAVVGPGPGRIIAPAPMASLPVDQSLLGATGALPLSTAHTGEAATPTQLPNSNKAPDVPGTRTVTVVPATYSDRGIPQRVLVAYRRAAARSARTDPGCHLRWELLAAIGRIEAGHAEGGRLDAAGVAVPPILGPVLSGGPGIAAVRDSDAGRLDGDRTWDRAVGPMQFLPSTWLVYGHGNPQDVDDAALATSGYLCAGGTDLNDAAQLPAAVFRYNHSDAYVANVLAWSRAYRDGATPSPTITLLATAKRVTAAVPVRAGRVLLQMRPLGESRKTAHVPTVPTAARPSPTRSSPSPTRSPLALPTPTTSTGSGDAAIPSGPGRTACPPFGTPSPTASPTEPATASPASTPRETPTSVEGTIVVLDELMATLSTGPDHELVVDLSAVSDRPEVGDRVRVSGTPSPDGTVLIADKVVVLLCEPTAEHSPTRAECLRCTAEPQATPTAGGQASER